MQKEVGWENGKYGYYYKDKQGQEIFKELGNVVCLDSIKHNIDTDTYVYDVSFVFKNDEIHLSIPRENMTSYDILQYKKNGIAVNNNSAYWLVESIELQVENPEVKVVYEHNKLGWAIYKDMLIFKSQYINLINSTYCGNINILPSGSLDEWEAFINEYVTGNTPLEFAVIAGLSAVLIGYAGEMNDNECLLLNFVGESSSGKTTAAYLAISVAGLPEFSENTLLRTWNATLNAILKSLVGNYGYPVVFDEFSMNTQKDFNGFLYALSSGREKDRMNKDLNLKETEGFRTTIITTGEESILNKCKNTTGLSMRLIEFNNVQWTESAEQAEIIKQKCTQYYGTAIVAFSDLLLRCKREDVLNLFNKYRNGYIKSSKFDDRFTGRLSKKYAVLLTTAHLANKFLNLNFNIEKLLKFMVENEAKNAEYEGRHVGAKAYEKLMEYITVHLKNFYVSIKTQDGYINNIPNNTEIWGDIVEQKNSPDRLVYIPTNKFNQIIQELGFADSSIILKQFRDDNLLKHDKDRLTVKHAIHQGAPSIRCYAIKMNNTIPQ